MIKGYLKHNFDMDVGERRVNESLKILFPCHHEKRKNGTAKKLNPIPYRADYFGHKLHIDQNEKLVNYGVTHVAAIDGHSRFVVAGTSMPIKNNLLIYEDVYR